MHECIAEGLREDVDLSVRTATLHDPEHGLTEDVLEKTDVLMWWGHAAHGKVNDNVVERVLTRVWQGMGFIALHSSHYSKIFKRLMGTSCSLTWREAGEKERVWVCNPAHPIARGIDRYFEIENSEMYGEPFAIPTPDEIVFISWFEGGDVFRSGCTWKRGNGKIFYFRPATKFIRSIIIRPCALVLRNAVKWAAPDAVKWIDSCPQIPADKAPEPLTVKGPHMHKEGEAGFQVIYRTWTLKNTDARGHSRVGQMGSDASFCRCRQVAGRFCVGPADLSANQRVEGEDRRIGQVAGRSARVREDARSENRAALSLRFAAAGGGQREQRIPHAHRAGGKFADEDCGSVVVCRAGNPGDPG